MEQTSISRAAAAHPGEADFWPADSLASWVNAAHSTFHIWLAQQRILGTRHFRESTKDTYFAMFATWVAFLEQKRMLLLEATGKEAEEFFGDRGLVPVSRRRYLQLIDKVYQHLLTIGWPGPHPLKGLLAQERELSIALPKGLDTAQLGKLTQALQMLEGSKAKRDRALAALMLGAGLRSNEVIFVKCSEVSPQFDVEVSSHTVHQAHTTLVLPDGPWRHWIEEWKAERHQRMIPGELLCPATSKGKPYTASGLFRRIAHWFEIAGVQPEQGGVNVLRNTFARLALASGRYGLTEVQGFMGHEELRTTQRHLEITVPTPYEDVPSLMGSNKKLEFEHAIEDRPTQVDLLSGGGAVREADVPDDV